MTCSDSAGSLPLVDAQGYLPRFSTDTRLLGDNSAASLLLNRLRLRICAGIKDRGSGISIRRPSTGTLLWTGLYRGGWPSGGLIRHLVLIFSRNLLLAQIAIYPPGVRPSSLHLEACSLPLPAQTAADRSRSALRAADH